MDFLIKKYVNFREIQRHDGDDDLLKKIQGNQLKTKFDAFNMGDTDSGKAHFEAY